MEDGKRKVVRARGWLITVQAPKNTGNDWRLTWPGSWDGKYSYKCQCYERGVDACSIHTHVLVNFTNVRTSNRLAKELLESNKGCEIDIQQKRGKWVEARNYVLKQDNTSIEGRIPVESGTMPKDYTSKEERREEAEKIVNIIKDKGLTGMIEENAEIVLKHPMGCRLINDLVEKDAKKRTVMVTLIWGEAGTGKSTWAADMARRKWGKDVYFWTKVGGARDSIWFNGYKGQKCLIMDDISGRSLPFEYAIKITGNDPLDVEYKGGKCPARWKEVYITSNYNPEGWYGRVWEENNDSKEAFFRRITRIIHVYREDGNVVWDVEKDGVLNVMRKDFHITPVWKKTPSWVREEREGERKRMEKEREMMLENDINTKRKEITEEEIDKSGEGLQEHVEKLPLTQPDTPGNGMYWGGADTFYLDYGPIKKGRVESELKKEKAFLLFMKWFNIERKNNGADPLEEDVLKAAIRDGRLKYNEKKWIRVNEKLDEARRSHEMSEEEWDPLEGYHDLRHEDEIECIFNHQPSENDEQSFNSQWWEKEHIEEIE